MQKARLLLGCICVLSKREKKKKNLLLIFHKTLYEKNISKLSSYTESSAKQAKEVKLFCFKWQRERD